MKNHSPLLFPVTFDGKRISVLDETQLPWKEIFIQVDSLSESLTVLKEMKTRAFGQVLLFYYTSILASPMKPTAVADCFHEIRPTFDFHTLASMLEKSITHSASIHDAADKLIDNIDTMRLKRAELLATLLPQDTRILTICNISGELIYIYEAMKNTGKSMTVYVSETRPYLQGSRLTLWELARCEIPCCLLCDNQAASLMESGNINAVITGSDRSTKNGDIINKTGTYALAVLASVYSLPFYSYTQFPLDISVNDIPIEERDTDELFNYSSLEEYPPSIYPGFDIVPSELITRTVRLGEGI